MKDNKKTTEQRVGDTILQQPHKITVGLRTYTVAPPTVATLILASEAISTLPHIDMDNDNLVEESLNVAKDCRPLGEIMAILILGAQGLKEMRTVKEDVERDVPRTVLKSYLWGLIKRPVEVSERRTESVEKVVEVDRKKELADEILNTYTPRELHLLFASLLKDLQLADFFGLTTFLTGVNLLRPTKVEETS